MTSIRRARCPQCGARLRRGRHHGELCHPCQQVGPHPRSALPPDFYDRQPIMALLAAYDFGPFFLTVRDHTGWSQQTLGGVTGLDQTRISAIERGIDRLRDIELIATAAQGLSIPPARLNFPDIGVTVGPAEIAEREDVSWVDRRDFGQHIAAAILGIAGASGLDTDRLLALLPHPEPTGTRHVGDTDVEIIEQLTESFVRQDFARGSGLIRDAAVAQLHTVLPLLNAQISPEVRPRLLLATARLATQAGYMSFQVRQHDAARRLWMIGLDLARKADHPLATDQTVFLLYDMAVQAMHLGRPDEALHLTRIGHAASVSQYPVSSTTSCILTNIQARAYAAQRDATGCDRALGQAVEQLSATKSALDESWTDFLDESMLAGYQGVAYYELAQAGRDSRAAGRAVPLLRHAVDQLGHDYTRVRALYLPDLAGAHALAGDLDTAVSVGHQAIDAVSMVSSPRAYDRLRTLNTVLEPLHTSPGVAELRDRLSTSTV